MSIRIRQWLERALVACTAALFCVLPALGAPVTRNHDLTFHTANQGLFDDSNAVETELVRFHVLNQQFGPRTQGRIVNTQTALPVSTLVAIWTRALNICRAQSFTIPVLNLIAPVIATAFMVHVLHGLEPNAAAVARQGGSARTLEPTES